MDVKEETILGPDIASHWYYVAKGRALRRLLATCAAREVLDVGAGSGVFSRQLLDAGICQSAVCVDTAYESDRSELHNGKEIRFRRAVEEVPQKLLLMIDVLEHVDDDVGLLRHYARSMPIDGRILVSVPAFQFLWSGHDIFLEHRRRYTLRQLERVARAAGLEPLVGRYFFASVFPAACVLRLLDRRRVRRRKAPPQSALKKHGPVLNRALIGLLDSERETLFRVNRLAGLSVFCLAGLRA